VAKKRKANSKASLKARRRVAATAKRKIAEPRSRSDARTQRERYR
jgi:hypothetical protein